MSIVPKSKGEDLMSYFGYVYNPEIKVVVGDITQYAGDAIVNPANIRLRRGDGICGEIFKAAGANVRELTKACHALAPVPTGEAVITEAYGLKCKYIIHAVVPKWQDGLHGEPLMLASAYASAFGVAYANGCRNIAFPVITIGANKEDITRIAIIMIYECFIALGDKEDDLRITLYVNDNNAVALVKNEFPELVIIRDHWAQKN
jgi:O-acetyl-ADP-ribose deacetylase (regulator of RNase III)